VVPVVIAVEFHFQDLAVSCHVAGNRGVPGFVPGVKSGIAEFVSEKQEGDKKHEGGDEDSFFHTLGCGGIIQVFELLHWMQ